jgi:hypothetical protein
MTTTLQAIGLVLATLGLLVGVKIALSEMDPCMFLNTTETSGTTPCEIPGRTE